MNLENGDTINEIARQFIANPEAFQLYRGEKPTNQGGLHFTTDKYWARQFGKNIHEGRLPAGCKIKLISPDDFEFAFKTEMTTEGKLWAFLFSEGYDAIIGRDTMNSGGLDVIVNPIHSDRFKRLHDEA